MTLHETYVLFVYTIALNVLSENLAEYLEFRFSCGLSHIFHQPISRLVCHEPPGVPHLLKDRPTDMHYFSIAHEDHSIRVCHEHARKQVVHLVDN